MEGDRWEDWPWDEEEAKGEEVGKLEGVAKGIKEVGSK